MYQFESIVDEVRIFESRLTRHQSQLNMPTTKQDLAELASLVRKIAETISREQEMDTFARKVRDALDTPGI